MGATLTTHLRQDPDIALSGDIYSQTIVWVENEFIESFENPPDFSCAADYGRVFQLAANLELHSLAAYQRPIIASCEMAIHPDLAHGLLRSHFERKLYAQLNLAQVDLDLLSQVVFDQKYSQPTEDEYREFRFLSIHAARQLLRRLATEDLSRPVEWFQDAIANCRLAVHAFAHLDGNPFPNAINIVETSFLMAINYKSDLSGLTLQSLLEGYNTAYTRCLEVSDRPKRRKVA